LDPTHQPASSWHTGSTGEETGSSSRTGPESRGVTAGATAGRPPGASGWRRRLPAAAGRSDPGRPPPPSPAPASPPTPRRPPRPPQHSLVGPLVGQHPSRQGNGQRRAVAADGQPQQTPAGEGVEATRAPRIGGVVGAPEPALGRCVSRIPGTARQRKEPVAYGP